MTGLDMNNFIPTPLKDAMDIERIQGAQYQNMLTQQAMQQEAEKRRGYESAYQNMLAQQQMPQQQSQMETIEPTPELAKLGYGSFQAQPEQQAPQPVQPYQAPAGSSYDYIQGVEQQNALAQKQQVSYYEQRIEPMLKFAIAGGHNDIKDKLIAEVNSYDSPQAGLARDFLNMIKDVNISAPGQLDNVRITPKMKQVLSGMTQDDVMKATIEETPDGSIVSLKMNQAGDIATFGTPKPTTGGTRIIKRDVGGVPHNIMVGLDGEDIKDMGPAPMTGARGNAPLSADQEKAAQAYAKALKEGRTTLDKIPAYRGMRDRVFYLAEGGDSQTGEPISYTGDIAKSKSAAGSLAFVTKQHDMTKSFLGTIDSNIDQLKSHIADMSTRHSVDRGKIMNMGVREYLKRFEGDADINIYDMLVGAISTENAKLQSGGAGSVAQVAEGARTQMEKIHDSNMPVKEMLKLLEATRKEGGNRMGALEKQMKESGSRTERVAGSKDVPPQLIQAMQKEIKTKLSDKKVKAGDNVTFKWKDGKRYQVTIGANGGFSGWKYVE